MNNLKRKKGFTIGQLLLFLLISSVMIASLIYFFFKTRDKASLISTMATMKNWGEAISCYIADHSVAPTNPLGVMNYKKPILKEVSPYLNSIYVYDWGGFPFRIWTGKGISQYGITTTSDKDFIIASFGHFGAQDGWKYDPKNPLSGFYKIKKREDLNNDIVIWNNKFIRCPKSKQ